MVDHDDHRVYAYDPDGTHDPDSGFALHATTSVWGTVFSDANWNGVQDPGEDGIAGYDRMLAIDSAGNVMNMTTDKNGNYYFEVAPGEATLVQTHYFPLGHVVVNPDTSWHTYVVDPKEGDQIEFNVGFHPVTDEEMVDFEIRMFVDANGNGKRDQGEQGVPGFGVTDTLTFYVYTYTTGPVAYPVTDDSGVATVKLIPADFALLVDIDNLAEQGYYWTSTNYERSDDYAGKQYLPTYPIADDPAPGSRHVMEIGLSPS